MPNFPHLDFHSKFPKLNRLLFEIYVKRVVQKLQHFHRPQVTNNCAKKLYIKTLQLLQRILGIFKNIQTQNDKLKELWDLYI